MPGPPPRKDAVEVDLLRWSHDKIYDHFSCDRSIFQTVVELLLGTVSVEDIPPLRIVKLGDLLYSLSNRRLYALKLFKRVCERFGNREPVHATVVFEDMPSGYAFTTWNQGETVELSKPATISFVKHEKGGRHLSLDRKRELSKSRSPSRRPTGHCAKESDSGTGIVGVANDYRRWGSLVDTKSVSWDQQPQRSISVPLLRCIFSPAMQAATSTPPAGLPVDRSSMASPDPIVMPTPQIATVAQRQRPTRGTFDRQLMLRVWSTHRMDIHEKMKGFSLGARPSKKEAAGGGRVPEAKKLQVTPQHQVTTQLQVTVPQHVAHQPQMAPQPQSSAPAMQPRDPITGRPKMVLKPRPSPAMQAATSTPPAGLPGPTSLGITPAGLPGPTSLGIIVVPTPRKTTVASPDPIVGPQMAPQLQSSAPAMQLRDPITGRPKIVLKSELLLPRW